MELSEWGIRLFYPAALKESFPWTDLTVVTVITTPHALPGEDLYLVLYGTGTIGLIVPPVVTVESNQITALETRLPGFETATLATAASCYTDGISVLWTAAWTAR